MPYTIDPRNFYVTGACDGCGEVFVGGVSDIQKKGWLLNVKKQILLCEDCRKKMKKDGDSNGR